jgi:UDP:flavonoid glycosyltransferase YjiC (YdhE family)
VIQNQIEKGSDVYLGGSGKSAELLKTTFPGLPLLTLSCSQIRYSKNTWGTWARILLQMPRFLFDIIHEHIQLRRIVKEFGINLVISDNRYGLFCRKAYCIFITHQLSPVLPSFLRWAEFPLFLVIKLILAQYDECWIPDYANSTRNLSGKLSHRFTPPAHAKYIGPLSRFRPLRHSLVSKYPSPYDLVVVVSGPEPQSGLFLQKMLGICSALPYRTLVISGWQNGITSTSSHITILPHLDTLSMISVLLNAKAIVCRSGYSTIMDLFVLGKPALLVPTPGQSEQLYLAKTLAQKKCFPYIQQHLLNYSSVMNFIAKRVEST